jgi:hypothetical protein
VKFFFSFQNFDISQKNIINVKAAKVIYGSELSLSLSLSLFIEQEGGGSWTMLCAHQVQICSFSTKDMFTSDRKTLLLYSQCHDCQLVGVKALSKHVSSCTDPCPKGPPLLELLHAEMATEYLLMGQSKHHKGWMDGWWVGMKHFSVGFQLPGYIVAMMVSSVAVYTSIGRVLLTHLVFRPVLNSILKLKIRGSHFG